MVEDSKLVRKCYSLLHTGNRPSNTELKALGLDISIKWSKSFISIDKLNDINFRYLRFYLELKLNNQTKKKKNKRKNKPKEESFLRKSAKKTSKHSTVYLILMWKGREKFLKVGMTTTSIEKRFRETPYSYKVIHSVDVDREILFEYEQAVHGTVRKYSYRPTIKFVGHTECYRMEAKTDILTLLR